jgi:hypothetical protein
MLSEIGRLHMTQIEPEKPRYTIQQTGSSVVVSAPARRNWLILIFILVWLGGWTVGGAQAIPQAIQPGEQQAFMAFWSIGWLLGELYAIAIVVWQLAGREELILSANSLVHRVAAGGLNRRREFSSANIKHLRATPQTTSPLMDQGRWMPPIFGAGHGSIAFDYGAKTYRVGAGLDEAEARLVLGEIRKFFPRMVEGQSAN